MAPMLLSATENKPGHTPIRHGILVTTLADSLSLFCMPLTAYLCDVFIHSVWPVCISYIPVPGDAEGWVCGSDRPLEDAYQS